MLASRNTHHDLPAAQAAALDAVASVVFMHLEDERTRSDDTDSAPVLIHVDGPGDAEMVDMVAHRLRSHTEESQVSERPNPSSRVPGRPRRQPPPAWTVIRFDAWQYQRLAPPWWWLINALDGQLRDEFRRRGPSVLRRKRLRDYRWRVGHFVHDLLPVVPLVFAAVGLWYISGRLPMDQFFKWAVGLIGALTTLGAFLFSAGNGVRRLLVGSRVNLGASMRTSDPMEDLRTRYSFLTRSADSAVALVIDNVDRCRAEYVVELLEGIQTLLKSPSVGKDRTPLVAVLVPAERAWLCDSYLQVYNEFQDAMHQPGRPYGLAFVDKVFDVALRLPRLAPTGQAGVPLAAAVPTEDQEAALTNARSERAIRELVAGAEARAAEDSTVLRPAAELRLRAVRRLGRLEVGSPHGLCLDTGKVLEDLIDAVAPGPTVARQLRTAYCVQRTTQLLGGHPIETDRHAIHRLGLWTILDLRWPLLAQHLARHPDHVTLLQQQQAPAGVSDDLEYVFNDPEAARLTTAWSGAELSPNSVRHFSCVQAADVGSPGAGAAAHGVSLACAAA
jgi:hypothetical protein